jgi:hypothetical protein
MPPAEFVLYPGIDPLESKLRAKHGIHLDVVMTFFG